VNAAEIDALTSPIPDLQLTSNFTETSCADAFHSLCDMHQSYQNYPVKSEEQSNFQMDSKHDEGDDTGQTFQT